MGEFQFINRTRSDNFAIIDRLSNKITNDIELRNQHIDRLIITKECYLTIFGYILK